MEGNPVSIIDIRIPFWRLVAFFIKAGIAAIPAAIVLTILSYVMWVLMLSAMIPRRF